MSALWYDYRYEYNKLSHHAPQDLTDDFYVHAYISFDDNGFIPLDGLLSINEWHAGPKRKYMLAILHFVQVRGSNWWKENNVSLTLKTDGILEESEVKKININLSYET